MDQLVKFFWAGKSTCQIPLSKLKVVDVFLRQFHVRIWRGLFTSFSADEFQLNSKSAFIRKCIHKGTNIYKCTSVVIRLSYDWVFFVNTNLIWEKWINWLSFLSWEIHMSNSTFETKSRWRFFAPIPRSYLERAIYVIFSRWISIELKKCIYT